MSFGTGLHPTTQACLNFLDAFADSASLLGGFDVTDLGCGSGILAIAAAKFGFGAVSAVDFDPVAVQMTRENMALNKIPAERISVCRADVTKDVLPLGNVVIANILASVLIQSAANVAAAVKKSSRSVLVISGVLDSQFGEVAGAFAAQGFSVRESWLDREWRSAALVRR